MASINAGIHGEGPTVVLLHGFCEDHTLWDEISAHLKQNFKVISIDLPGFGKSPVLPRGFNLADVAHAVQQNLLDNGLQNYTVIGHSLGGYVALALTHLYPESIAALGLIHSTAMADSEKKKVNRNKAIAFINTYGVEPFLGQFVPSLFLPANRIHLSWAIQKVTAMSHKSKAAVIIGYMEAMRDRPEYLGLLQASRVLYIYGADDPLFSAEDIERQTSIIENKNNILCLDQTAHMGMYEAADTLCSKMSEFLLGG